MVNIRSIGGKLLEKLSKMNNAICFVSRVVVPWYEFLAVNCWGWQVRAKVNQGLHFFNKGPIGLS